MTTEFIYGLQCPILNAVVYVGRTINPASRFVQHLSPPPWDNSRRAQWIRALKAEELRPEMVILEECATEDANLRERHWIDFHKTQNPELLNGVIPIIAGTIKKMMLRLPPDLHQMVKEEAAKNNRSLNQQIVYICSAIINGDVDTLHRRVAELQRERLN